MLELHLWILNYNPSVPSHASDLNKIYKIARPDADLHSFVVDKWDTGANTVFHAHSAWHIWELNVW